MRDEIGSLFDVGLPAANAFTWKWTALEDELTRLPDEGTDQVTVDRVNRLAGEAEAKWTVALDAA